MPKTFKQLQKVYGLLLYFWAFVSRFATIAAPLARMMRADGLSQWTEGHTLILLKVLEYLSQEAELALPDSELLFVLEFDVGKSGFGGVLL